MFYILGVIYEVKYKKTKVATTCVTCVFFYVYRIINGYILRRIFMKFLTYDLQNTL